MRVAVSNILALKERKESHPVDGLLQSATKIEAHHSLARSLWIRRGSHKTSRRAEAELNFGRGRAAEDIALHAIRPGGWISLALTAVECWWRSHRNKINWLQTSNQKIITRITSKSELIIRGYKGNIIIIRNPPSTPAIFDFWTNGDDTAVVNSFVLLQSQAMESAGLWWNRFHRIPHRLSW